MTATTAHIPRTMVRLKARLVMNRAKASTSNGMTFAFAVTGAVVFGLFGFVQAVVLGTSDDPRAQRTALVLGASLLTVGWSVLPLFTLGTDETLDPGRLVLFPLRRAPLMRGLLLSSFVGPVPGAVMLVAIGAVAGYAQVSLLIVPAMVLLLLLSAAAARTLSTALAAGANSRRGRDAAIVFGSLLLLSVQAIRFVDFSFIDADTIDRADGILRWWPPGMLGQAVIDAGNGRTALALAELVPAAVLIPVLLWIWGRTLDRALTNVSDGETRHKRRDVRVTAAAGGQARPARSALHSGRLPFLEGSPWGAVAAKELRYLWRDPRRKVNLVNSVLFAVGVPLFFALRSSGGLHGSSVLLVSFTAYIVLLNSLNQFGLDGAATWVDVVAGDTMRSVLIGKNAAVALLVLPLVTVPGGVVAARTDGWVYLPSAVLLTVAGLGAGLATANVVSVRFPFRLPENRSPFSGSGGGQGCASSVLVALAMIVQVLMLIPVVVVAGVGAAIGPGWLFIAAGGAVVYGSLLWLGGLAMATSYGRDHEPERIDAVNPARVG